MELLDFEIVDVSKINDEYPQKRDCLSEITDYLDSKNQKKILALYGLRRTGKTVLMQQALSGMASERKKKSVFITCNRNSDFNNVLSFMKRSIAEGKRFFFIDEVTYAKNFQNLAEILSDNFAAIENAKIIVTGTDSLGLSLPSHSNLYDRVRLVHTTYTPFAEFARITGNKSIDYYLRHGSTLSSVSPFENFAASNEYVETSIVENFISSLSKSEGIRTYPPSLTELYDNDELENAIQRIINHYSQTITMRALRKQFELSPLENGLNAIAKKGDFELKSKVYAETVTDNVRKLLRIDDFTTSLTEKHLDEVKKFLEEMDVITRIPVATSYADKKQDRDIEMITHPGMYHANLSHTLMQLRDDENWLPDASREQKETLLKAVYETAAGKIQENFIIADVYKMLGEKENLFLGFEYIPQSRWYVSKFSAEVSGKQEEVDLLIFDKKEKESYLFEIKHSKIVVPEQATHLESEKFRAHIEKNFGTIKGTAVLYNGATDASLKTPRFSIAEFLTDIYDHSKEADYSMSDTIERLLSCHERKIFPQKSPDGYGR